MSRVTTFLLPKSHSDSKLWSSMIAKQKHFRLSSLQLAPDAFSSTYERETTFTDEIWDARLCNPLAHTFIAVASPDDQRASIDFEDAVEGEWVGIDVLYGPLHDNATKEELDHGRSRLDFEIFGLFVVPSARKTGLGKTLVEAAIARGRTLSEERGADEVVIKVRAASSNIAALRLYEQLGFKVVESVGTGTVSRETVGMELRMLL